MCYIGEYRRRNHKEATRKSRKAKRRVGGKRDSAGTAHCEARRPGGAPLTKKRAVEKEVQTEADEEKKRHKNSRWTKTYSL